MINVYHNVLDDWSHTVQTVQYNVMKIWYHYHTTNTHRKGNSYRYRLVGQFRACWRLPLPY